MREAESQVSIIIPNLNSKMIDETLQSLLAQTALGRIAEIIVVGLDEPGLVYEHNFVCFVDTKQPVTAPVARNIGIRLALGKYLAFIDSDCVADRRWLENLLQAQEAGHPVTGGSISFSTTPYWQLCYNLTMFHDFVCSASLGDRKNMGTLNLCVARDVVEHVGLMDERLARGQDTEWTLRMRRHGYRLHFVADAVVQHCPEVPSLTKILKLWHRSGQFNAWVRNHYKELISPPPFYKYPLLLVLSSPLIGFAVTMRIFMRNPHLLRYIHTFPVVFLSKIAWCFGASRRIEL